MHRSDERAPAPSPTVSRRPDLERRRPRHDDRAATGPPDPCVQARWPRCGQRGRQPARRMRSVARWPASSAAAVRRSERSALDLGDLGAQAAGSTARRAARSPSSMSRPVVSRSCGSGSSRSASRWPRLPRRSAGTSTRGRGCSRRSRATGSARRRRDGTSSRRRSAAAGRPAWPADSSQGPVVGHVVPQNGAWRRGRSAACRPPERRRVVSELMTEPMKTPWAQSKASRTRGTTAARRPPNMIASMGTPAGSSHSAAIAGSWRAGAVKRELAWAATRPASGVQSRPVQSMRCGGGVSVRPSHQTSPSSVRATLVKMQLRSRSGWRWRSSSCWCRGRRRRSRLG